MRKVVVNSTPLIILCGIGRLDILRMVYQEISIPTAVFRKVTAKYLGLPVTGTLGVLIKAKRMGIIESVKPLITELRKNGFYVSGTVERMVLEQAGE